MNEYETKENFHDRLKKEKTISMFFSHQWHNFGFVLIVTLCKLLPLLDDIGKKTHTLLFTIS